MIGKTISHYRILDKLGGGGMGVVYKAEDTKLGRFVALKFLSESVVQNRKAVERFMLEARAAAALSHPHICTIHEIDEHDGVPFIVMEYLEGQNLKSAIAGKPMPVELVIEMGIQVAEALAAAHAKGITHRDIKPSNIFINQGGQIKVVDFGLAKLSPQVIPASEAETITADAPTQTADLTATGSTMGTTAYMSPEQALGQDVDACTDLFSLGAVLYEMITGRQAFPGSTQAAVFDKILNREPPTPTRLGLEVPYELEQIVQKALEKNKVLRYQSALEVHTDLRRVRRTIESGSSAAVPATDESYFDGDHPISGSAAVVAPDRGTAPVAGSPSGSAAVQYPPGSAEVPLAQTPSGSAAVPAQPGKSKRTLWILSALLVVAAAAIVGLLLQRTSTPALTASDVLLLADVVNSTGDSDFDGTLKQALAVKLEESPHLNILSERKVQETLRMMGREGTERVSPEIGQEICERQGIKAMVTGEIAALGNNFVITLNAVECETGISLARQQVEATKKEGVLAAVGEATTGMRRELGESLASIERYDAPLEQATTASLEALKSYNLGNEQRSEAGDRASIPYFERAIELDPSFAMALARLGAIYSNQGEPDRSKDYFSRAFELSDRVTEPERLYITARYYGSVVGDIDKEVETYKLWKSIYPRDWTPYTNLTVFYGEVGDFESALKEAQEAMRLDPDHVFSYINLSLHLLNLGRLEEAKVIAQQAVDRGFSDVYLHCYLWLTAYRQKDESEMERQREAVAGSPDEAWMLSFVAGVRAKEGRLTEMRSLNDQAIVQMERSGAVEMAALIKAETSVIELTTGSVEQALALASDALDTGASRWVLLSAVVTLGLGGDAETASELVEDMNRRYPGDTWIQEVIIPAARTAIAVGAGRASEATGLLDSARPYEEGRPVVLYLRGLALQASGDFAAATTEFERLAGLRRGIWDRLPLSELAHVALARTAAAAGDTDRARSAYQDFLELWQEADEDIPILVEAKAEYAALP